MKKVLFIFGTRPEAIKMAPVALELLKEGNLEIRMCSTGQHRQMLDQVISFFELKIDYECNLMQHNQTLAALSADLLINLQRVFCECKPDLVLVQGDTTTACMGALAAFYNKIPIGHIEAGLRSYNKFSPYPEEVNRKLISGMADLHFAPTEAAENNLKKEDIEGAVWTVGNPVIDALSLGLSIIQKKGISYEKEFSFINFKKRIILVTGHRRESFGKPLESICTALREIVKMHTDIEIVYPVHLNPNVQIPVKKLLSNCPAVHLLDPLDYSQCIWLMNKSYLILTDSGGIQEEAPFLGKPVLVMRDITERMEGIIAGTARLVGTGASEIVNQVSLLLHNEEVYMSMSKNGSPYGDGTASKKIAAIVKEFLS